MVATVYSRRPLHVRVPRAVTRLAGMAWRVAVFAALLLGMTLLARRVELIAYGELAAPLAVTAACMICPPDEATASTAPASERG